MWYNFFMVGLLRSPLRGMLDKNFMLVTYCGRKSGKRYTIPVNYLKINQMNTNELTTLSLKSRTWWRNLRGDRLFQVQMQGKVYPATAELIEAEAKVAEHLGYYLQSAPKMGRYFDVRIEDGLPNSEDLAQAAENRVIIVTRLGMSEEN